MNLLSKIIGKKKNKVGDVEKKLAKLMERKRDVGEFSIDLYLNDCCGSETCYVAKLTMYGKYGITYHARCANFGDAIDKISEHIDKITKK